MSQSAAAIPNAVAATSEVDEKGEDPVSYYRGTRQPGPAEPLAQVIRSHWGGCEIRNPWSNSTRPPQKPFRFDHSG